MARESAFSKIAEIAAKNHGVFTGQQAVDVGVTRDQLTRLVRDGVSERLFPNTYRVAGIACSTEARLTAALLWAGPDAAAAAASAGQVYGFEGVRASEPEIVVPARCRRRCSRVTTHRSDDRRALMIRDHRGFRITGVEATLVALAHQLDGEAFEIACEDARRRNLTSMRALHAYLDRFGRAGRPGVTATRALLKELDPKHPAKSTLEVKTRRLLVANGITDFVRELKLEWNGRAYFYDFAFEQGKTILETNGRRWHDDPTDFEYDQEKWSVPGRHGYRLVLATRNKVTHTPLALLQELNATLAA